MKAKITEAPPVAAPNLPADLPPEGMELAAPEGELPAEGIADFEVDPVGTKPDLERSELEATAEGEPTDPLPAALGRDGKPLSPENAKILYDQLVLTDEMLEQGRAAGLGPTGLWKLAQQYRAVYPDTWRELLAQNLAARAAGDLAAMTMDEKLARHLVVSPERQLYELGEKLQDRLNEWRPEDRVVVLRELIDTLEKKIAKLKSGGVKKGKK